MTVANLVANKSRTIAEIASLEANAAYPTFSPLTQDPQVFLGDFTGALIAGFEFEVGTLATVTALNGTIQHSDDGENWYSLKSLTEAGASDAKSYVELDDTDPKPMRYLRVNLVATGSYGSITNVKVSVKFNQVGCKGRYAPPGFKNRID